MPHRYNLTIDTDWNSLPWQKIYNKILILQKKIYKVTKKYCIDDKFKIQEYLLNSIEAKIFSIENIVNELYSYYEYKKKIKYKLTNKDKFNILQKLINNNQSNQYDFLVQLIKQSLVFLCIKPEWQAKTGIISYQFFNKTFTDKTINKFMMNNWINFNLLVLKKIKHYKFLFENIKSVFSNLILNNFIQLKYLFLIKTISFSIDWYNLYLNNFHIQKIFFLNQLRKKILQTNSSENQLLIKFLKSNNYKLYLLFYIKFFIYNEVLLKKVMIKDIQNIYLIINNKIYYYLRTKYSKRINKIRVINLNIYLNNCVYKKKIEHKYISY